MPKAVAVVALAVAAVVALLMAALAYALTSEYGASPNGGGLSEALSAVGTSVPGALLVAILVALGARSAPARLRLVLAVGAALVALLGVGLGMLLGDRALQQRCDERGVEHSAACPGHTGPLTRGDRPDARAAILRLPDCSSG